MVQRIDSTQKANELIKVLQEKHGELMFYQAGGCCEGTQPQCFEKGEFYLRMNDVCIGEFSLETPLGKTFQIHYRIFTPEELEKLAPVKLA